MQASAAYSNRETRLNQQAEAMPEPAAAAAAPAAEALVKRTQFAFSNNVFIFKSKERVACVHSEEFIRAELSTYKWEYWNSKTTQKWTAFETELRAQPDNEKFQRVYTALKTLLRVSGQFVAVNTLYSYGLHHVLPDGFYDLYFDTYRASKVAIDRLAQILTDKEQFSVDEIIGFLAEAQWVEDIEKLDKESGKIFVKMLSEEFRNNLSLFIKSAWNSGPHQVREGQVPGDNVMSRTLSNQGFVEKKGDLTLVNEFSCPTCLVQVTAHPIHHNVESLIGLHDQSKHKGINDPLNKVMILLYRNRKSQAVRAERNKQLESQRMPLEAEKAELKRAMANVQKQLDELARDAINEGEKAAQLYHDSQLKALEEGLGILKV
jgi:hypothetical protein